MKLIKFTLLIFILSNQIIAQTTATLIETEKITIGEKIKIKSQMLSEDRILNIYLPHEYSKDSIHTYPVIYLLDGSIDEDFIHIAGIAQFGSFSCINMIPESIVVGIANLDRKRDFTYPSQNELDQTEFPTSGQSEIFIAFLENELQPFINSMYRTTSVKTIIGQSLGGLLATEILFKKPELFDNYIIVSPSLWWDDEKLLDQKPAAPISNKSIYIAGGKEGEVMERIAKELFNKLKKTQKRNTRLFYDFMENKTHGDALHIAVYNAFEKIFKPSLE